MSLRFHKNQIWMFSSDPWCVRLLQTSCSHTRDETKKLLSKTGGEKKVLIVNDCGRLAFASLCYIAAKQEKHAWCLDGCSDYRSTISRSIESLLHCNTFLSWALYYSSEDEGFSQLHTVISHTANAVGAAGREHGVCSLTPSETLWALVHSECFSPFSVEARLLDWTDADSFLPYIFYNHFIKNKLIMLWVILTDRQTKGKGKDIVFREYEIRKERCTAW